MPEGSGIETVQVVHRGRYLRLFRTDTGWEYVQRTNSAQGVMIVAITPEGRMLFVEQFRAPLQKHVIELPAGLVDRGESEIDAVKRELAEETGYECKTAECLCQGTTSPGLTDEQNSVFLAGDLARIPCASEDELSVYGTIRHRTNHGLEEEGERILVHEVPLDAAIAWLAYQQAEGKVIDLRVYVGLYFASVGRQRRD